MRPLAWLVWRDSRSAALGLARRLRQPRGALTAAGLALFCAVIASTGRAGATIGESLPAYGAPALMALVCLGALSPLGLYFRPADVHWLLGAPLGRAELVVYNVAMRARPALFSGLLLSLLPAWRGASWWSSFTGYTLVFLLLQISAQWLAGVRAWLALHRPGWTRPLGVALVALPVAAIALELRASPGLPFREFALESRALAVFGAPARPFLETLIAASPGRWLASAGLASALLAAAVAHLCVMRIPFVETALQHSERSARRLARMRGGGGAFGATPARAARRVPMLPRLGGAGPVAWRQVQELVRNPRGILLLLAVVGLVAAASVAVPLLRGDPQEIVTRVARTGIFLVTMLPLLMGDNLACDFRRDLDRLGQLKSWPVSPLAMAAGQIAPAALFATAVQVSGVLALVAVTGALTLPVTALVVALLPIVSWVALCIDNLFFLWMPYRTVPDDPGDVGFVGRTFATALFKFASLAAILGGTLALGFGALNLTGSPWAAVGVPVATLAAACVGGTWAVAAAFRRFDVAGDAPA